MQAELGPLFEIAKSAGPWGLLTAYLLYKDLYKPWRNGKVNGKVPNNQAVPAINAKDFATEKDVSELAKSFREFRREADERHNDFLQRMVRVETKVDSIERDHRDERRD